jgi:hypothetical protein
VANDFLVAEVRVYGIRDSLKILGSMDKQSRFAAIRQMKEATRPMTEIAKRAYPTEVPLSGMANKSRLQYEPNRVQRNLKAVVGGRARYGAAPLITLVQRDPGGALYDMAGLRNNAKAKRDRTRGQRTFTQNVTGRWGKAQRGMWRSIRQIRDVGYDAIFEALEEVAAKANRKLVR